MGTGQTTHTPARLNVSADLTFARWTNSGDQVKIGTIPAGSLVLQGIVNMSTAFSPTSLSLCQFQIGTSANASLFLSAGQIDTFSLAFSTINLGRGLLTSDTDVYVQLTKNAMAALPTTGRLQ